MFHRFAGALAASLVAFSASPICSQESVEKELGWSDTAEVSFVATEGNARANTLGLRNTLKRTWERALLTLDASALRASTGTTVRTAVGTAASFDVRKETDVELTAEKYFVRGRFDRNVSDGLFWYAGAGWDRNRFAGIENRYEGIGGIGNTWFEEERRSFKTTYGVSIVRQEDVVRDESVDEDFLAARFASDYMRRLGNSTYTNVFVANQNLSETSDIRFDMGNGLAVDLNSKMALKLAHQLLFDNRPALEELVLFSPDGAPADLTVLTPLEKFDQILTLALVIGF